LKRFDSKKKGLVFTIGVFDGVHLGHQALVKETIRLAKRLKAVPEALTFHDHPRHVLTDGVKVPFLLDRKTTFAMLKADGLQNVRVLPFNREFSLKSPQEFVRWLTARGPLKGVVVGQNFRFGRGAQGDVPLLKRMGKQYGFIVNGVPRVQKEGSTVSSSFIRELLSRGETEKANRFLGRPYFIEAKVVKGRQVGRKIGFPTANLGGITRLPPKDGVYACWVRVGNQIYRGGMNLGRRPTFKDADHHRKAEVHLLHYHGRLYGKTLRVYLMRYLRPEKKFPNLTTLQSQIAKDLQAIQSLSYSKILL
jgi:riboflavin kinase/FMN adenylyltransferase